MRVMWSQISSTDAILWVEKMMVEPSVAKAQDLVAQQIGIDGVEARERARRR